MTLNERLLHYDKLKAYDKALKDKNIEELLSILHSVGLKNYDMNNVDFIMKNTKRQ